MNKIQQIEEVVRRECPHLMELSFGCEVIIEQDFDSFTSERSETQIYHATLLNWFPSDSQGSACGQIFLKDTEGFSEMLDVDDADIKEIIGHPIQLSDILYVIGEERYLNFKIYEGYIRWSNNTSENYNLTLPFKDQSEEVINFLHNIICKK